VLGIAEAWSVERFVVVGKKAEVDKTKKRPIWKTAVKKTGSVK
jgi:hypothetical protein